MKKQLLVSLMAFGLFNNSMQAIWTDDYIQDFIEVVQEQDADEFLSLWELFFDAIEESEKKAIRFVKKLMSSGIDMNSKLYVQDFGFGPTSIRVIDALFACALYVEAYDLAKFLLQNGANINAKFMKMDLEDAQDLKYLKELKDMEDEQDKAIEEVMNLNKDVKNLEYLKDLKDMKDEQDKAIEEATNYYEDLKDQDEDLEDQVKSMELYFLTVAMLLDMDNVVKFLLQNGADKNLVADIDINLVRE